MALRKVGPQGIQNVKTYAALAAMLRGYGVAAGAGDGNCTPVNAAGQQGLGILQEDQPLVGGAALVTRMGDTVAIAGAAAVFGQYAKFNAAGQVIAVAGPAGSGEQVIGRFESSPTQLGDECVIFVSPFVY